MVKKIISVLIALSFISIPAYASTDYDQVGAYWECYTRFPDFVESVKAKNVSDKQIIRFLTSVKDELLTFGEDLNEENFDSYMLTAFKSAFKLVSNIKVRDALSSAYPDAAMAGMQGIIHEDFIPIYSTVRNFFFGKREGDFISLLPPGANLPDNFEMILALYDNDGILYNTTAVTANSDTVWIVKENFCKAKLFLWQNGNLAPLCEYAEYVK